MRLWPTTLPRSHRVPPYTYKGDEAETARFPPLLVSKIVKFLNSCIIGFQFCIIKETLDQINLMWQSVDTVL